VYPIIEFGRYEPGPGDSGPSHPGSDSQARTAAAQREVAYRGALPSSVSQSR